MQKQAKESVNNEALCVPVLCDPNQVGYLLVLAKPMNTFQIFTFTMQIFPSQEAKPINSTLNKFLKTKPFEFLDNKKDYVKKI